MPTGNSHLVKVQLGSRRYKKPSKMQFGDFRFAIGILQSILRWNITFLFSKVPRIFQTVETQIDHLDQMLTSM